MTQAADELRRLRLLMKQLKRMKFGYSLEHTDHSLFELGLEDLTQCIASAEIDQIISDESSVVQYPGIYETLGDIESLPMYPAQLDSKIRRKGNGHPHCSGALYFAQDALAELFDVAAFARPRVRTSRHRRCDISRCEEAATYGSILKDEKNSHTASESLLAYFLIKKYAEHLSLHYQVRTLVHQDVELDVLVLSRIVGRVCRFLGPLYDRLLEAILASTKVFLDRIDVSVLDPRRGRLKPGQLWAYAVDDRPWGGTVAPAVAYVYKEASNDEPLYLANFSGVLQVDRYGHFGRFVDEHQPGHVRLALCWARCRQRFNQIYEATNSPIAAQAVERITQLYLIEERISGQPAETRKVIRQIQSRPILEALQIWLRKQFDLVPEGSSLAKLIKDILTRWEAFTLFLDDGRVEIDSNTMERLTRPIALSRKNHCFAGFDGGAQQWTIVASLIQSAKLNGVEPLAYLADVLKHITACCGDGDKPNSLLPWAWKTRVE